MSTNSYGFRAMGTDVSLIGAAEHAAFERAAELTRSTFEREEMRCSRFRADSELSSVNSRAGAWTEISGGLTRIVSSALEAARRTQGRFDPTVLPAVLAAGYDRDFDEVLAGARAALRPIAPCGRWGEVEVRGSRLRMPPDVALDLGGFAKGWTVDLAAEAAIAAGLPWALVNAGGDLRLLGRAPGDGLEIAVEDPEDAGLELARLRLTHGALATSSITRRAWGAGLHHLIDPGTGRPYDGSVMQATVWAPTCAEAEVAAKDAVLAGLAVVERSPALVVFRDGQVHSSLEAA